jgi:hypothetical protein
MTMPINVTHAPTIWRHSPSSLCFLYYYYPYSYRLNQPCFELFNCYIFLFHIKHKQEGGEREIKNYAEVNKKKRVNF